MTDFSTEILPEEEEKTEQPLPKQQDAQEARKALATPAQSRDKADPVLAGAGNAMLANQLRKPHQRRAATTEEPSMVAMNKTAPPQAHIKQQPSLTSTPDEPLVDTATKPLPIPVKDPQPEPALAQRAEQAQADPAAERRYRLQLLTRTLSRLPESPENAPIEALFTAFLKAPMDEQADAALAIVNAVLRIDADTRRRTRIALTRAMTTHKSHPLAQLLAIRFGSWASTSPAPAAAPDADGNP
jgi:hypothetical protein